jgi:hypothetical protein
MRIAIEELRAVSEILLAHLEKESGAAIELNKDFYWSVPSVERYDSYRKPSKLSVGQLSDDWMELKRIQTGQGEPVGYGLVWLGAVFQALGEQNVA